MLKNQRLKEARKAAGMTQKELAEKLGVNQSYIVFLEKKENFSLEKATEIARVLKVEPEYLLPDEDGISIRVSEDEMFFNVLAFLKKHGKKIGDLIKEMGVSRTAFYYQIRNKNVKQSFRDSFKKITGHNIIEIMNNQ